MWGSETGKGGLRPVDGAVTKAAVTKGNWQLIPREGLGTSVKLMPQHFPLEGSATGTSMYINSH